MNEMLEQAKKLQEDMEHAQKRLETEDVEVSGGGGMVTFRITGSGKFTKCVIKPEFKEMTQEEQEAAVLSAAQAAIEASKKQHEEEMKKITSSLNLPGFDFAKGLEGGPSPRASKAREDAAGEHQIKA